MYFFATPTPLQRSLLSPHTSFWWGKGPFRKTFRSFRHSRATPGGSVLRLNTVRLYSMTQGRCAVLPFLKLWKKTFSPLPSSHFEQTQRNNMNCKMFFLTLSFATDKSNCWAKKCQQYRDEGWWFQGRSEIFRQNFPTGPGCFHHMYLNSQACPRLHSWLHTPSLLPAPLFYTFCFLTVISPDFTGHIVCLWIHSPVLTQNLLSSSSFMFQTKLQGRFCSKYQPSSWELPPSSWVSYYGLVLQHNNSRELISTPVLPPPHFSQDHQEFLHASMHGEMGRSSTAVGTTTVLAGWLLCL